MGFSRTSASGDFILIARRHLALKRPGRSGGQPGEHPIAYDLRGKYPELPQMPRSSAAAQSNGFDRSAQIRPQGRNQRSWIA
jgi:hypothetical protein